MFLSLTILFFSCQNNSPGNSKSKIVLGSPKAVVSTEPNSETRIKGPLAYAPSVPALEDGDTVEVKMDVTHKMILIAKGVSFTGWVFGDSLPGPVLRVRVGQTIKFSMTDRSDDSLSVSMGMRPMPHSIDFHSAMVNPADKYKSINAGETISFMWTANYPGVFMYHCGTPMVLLHMISGMVGMVIVEPKEGFPDKVDTSFTIVQNEYYVKPDGSIYLPDTVAAMHKQPSYVTFNGKANQYAIHAIRVKAGERIRLYLLNVGPNNATSFHVIGTILDKVWIDGNPANQFVGMQAVYLGPAQGAIVEFVLPEKGRYTFVDHSFADAEMGAMGEFEAD